MSTSPSEEPQGSENKFRQLIGRSILSVPKERVKEKPTSVVNPAVERPRAEIRAPESVQGGHLAVKAHLQQRLLDGINQKKLMGAGEDALLKAGREFVEHLLDTEEVALNETERKRLVDDLMEETMGVGPLGPLMADPAVSDILVVGADTVYVERYGRIERTPIRFRDEEHLLRIIQRIVARIGRHVDESSPMVDARLPDGSRVNATIRPVAINGPFLSIRRFGRHRLRRDDLLRLGMLSPDINAFLEFAVQARKNILISGGTGAGKSTFLGALSEAIPSDERIVTIEDTAELMLDQPHVCSLETRPANIEGQGRITARDLVINALRMRPDRIIVGEVRGPEALDMLQAMNTGHDGGMTTVHANTPRDALARLETMVLMAGIELPERAIREQMVSALQYIVHVKRFEDGVRRIASIAEITGMEALTPLTQEIFRFERRGRKGQNVLGDFCGTGAVPRLVDELKERDITVPMNLFRKPQGSSVHG